MSGEKMTLDRNEYRNLHGTVACSCGNRDLVAICYGYNYPTHRVEEWIVACDECVLETDDEPTLEQAIQSWNRKVG